MDRRQHDSRPTAHLGVTVEGTDPPVVTITAAGRTFTALPGDLLVCYRLSPYQRISNLNGDPCTHAAILDVHDGDAVTVEMGPKGVFVRTLEQFARRYDWFAVVHLDATWSQRQQAIAAAHDELRRRRVKYSHPQCVVIGSYALLRRWVLPFAESQLTWLALIAVRLAHRIHRGARTTCSGFVAQCFTPAGLFRTMPFPSRPRPCGRGRVRLADLELQAPRPHGGVVAPGPWAVIASPSDLVVCVAHTHVTVVSAAAVEILARRGSRQVQAA